MTTRLPQNIIITEAVTADLPAIQEIYDYYVRNTIISLEEQTPDIAQMQARMQSIIDNALPYLVAKHDNKIVGFAYATLYRPRTGYRFSVEESVYIDKDFHSLGIGKLLLTRIIEICKLKGYKQMLAVISGADNLASIKFHENLGFKKSGTLLKFGYKFNQWIDTVLMQKEL